MSNPTADHPLQKAARSVKGIIPEGTGFIIITAPFGENPKSDYVSNVSRESAIWMLKEILFRWGINDEWMKDAT